MAPLDFGTDILRGLVRETLEARHERMTRQYANKYREPRELPVHDRLFTNRFGKPLTMWGITSNLRRLDTHGWRFRARRPKALTDGAEIQLPLTLKLLLLKVERLADGSTQIPSQHVIYAPALIIL